MRPSDVDHQTPTRLTTKVFVVEIMLLSATALAGGTTESPVAWILIGGSAAVAMVGMFVAVAGIHASRFSPVNLAVLVAATAITAAAGGDGYSTTSLIVVVTLSLGMMVVGSGRPLLSPADWRHYPEDHPQAGGTTIRRLMIGTAVLAVLMRILFDVDASVTVYAGMIVTVFISVLTRWWASPIVAAPFVAALLFNALWIDRLAPPEPRFGVIAMSAYVHILIMTIWIRAADWRWLLLGRPRRWRRGFSRSKCNASASGV